jgi:hypothetical protein
MISINEIMAGGVNNFPCRQARREGIKASRADSFVFYSVRADLPRPLPPSALFFL